MRWSAVIAALIAAAVLPVASTAEPTRSALVRPGVGIGKVELGMTLEQVKRVLGAPPRTVSRRIDLGARGRYVEHGGEVDGPRTIYTWSVGFRSATRGGKLRAVRVGTTMPTQRTREGLGVGSRPRDIVRVHPDAICMIRGPEDAFSGTWIVVEAPGGMSAFLLDDLVYRAGSVGNVIEVLVQRSWFTRVRGRCLDEWEWRRW